MEQTINGNLSNCIQYANSIGGTTYYNVCKGSSYWVPWGSADWLGAAGITLLVLFFITVIGGLFYAASH